MLRERSKFTSSHRNWTPPKRKIVELRAATCLAGLLRDQGRRRQAHVLLAPSYNWFTEGLDTPVLQKASVVLKQLAG